MPQVPAQGGQKPYTEKPLKVWGEQYRVGAALPIGAVEAMEPLFPASGGPYANTSTGVFPLKDTDWVITDRYTGQAHSVLSDVDFQDRFSGPPP